MVICRGCALGGVCQSSWHPPLGGVDDLELLPQAQPLIVRGGGGGNSTPSVRISIRVPKLSTQPVKVVEVQEAGRTAEVSHKGGCLFGWWCIPK